MSHSMAVYAPVGDAGIACRATDECLNEHLFDSLRHARRLIAAWRDDCNHHRPHMGLDGLAPREFLNQSSKERNLNRTNF